MVSISIQLEDFVGALTGRSQSLLTDDLLQYRAVLDERIRGKRVLVIGGAGSIGSSYIKAIVPFEPASLLVVDTNENGLTELVRDLRSTSGLRLPRDFRTYPMSLGDQAFHRLFAAEPTCQIVANFAAHKHVRSEKDRFSIEAMLENNVIRAKRLLDALAEKPPSHFFCVSTDKATNPVNVMGASKSLMEKIIMAYSDVFPVSTARFANVAFSNGSLLEGFLNRLSKRQPISAPSDVKRYFVSPVESGQICLLASILGNTKEIMFPKLDYSRDLLTFSQIAEKLLLKIGLKAKICSTEEEARLLASKFDASGTEYPVYFFASDTTGEKPVEEFYSKHEQVDLSRFHALGVIAYRDAPTRQEATQMVNGLSQIFQNERAGKSEIVALMREFLPDFEHDEKGKNLDQKM